MRTTGPLFASLALSVLAPASARGQVTWQWIPHPAERSSAAFDPARGRVVRFGGRTSDRTWEWDGVRWSVAPTAGAAPTPRDWSTFVTDVAGSRALWFGGVADDPAAPFSTWSRAGTAWTRVHDGAGAPQGVGPGCWDSQRGRLVWLAATAPGETWALEANGWRVVASGGPSARSFHSIAYDPRRDRVVMHGGFSSGTNAETWEFDGASWTQVAILQTGPGARAVGAMVWDPDRAAVLLHGGSPFFAGTDATWAWDGVAWRVVGSGGPHMLLGLSLAHDPVRGVVVLCGGRRHNSEWNRETWELDANGWSLRHVEAWPASVDAIAMEPDTGRVVGVGTSLDNGYSLLPYETWRFDPASGQSRLLGTMPPARLGGVLVPHRGGRELLLWGGRTGSTGGPPMNQTWTLAQGAWSRLADGPPQRAGTALVFDSHRDRVVLFGGVSETNTMFGDTWEWDGNAWSQRVVAGPPARFEHAMAYDALARRTVLFGGVRFLPTTTEYLDDTWVFDGGAWTRLLTATVPPARGSHSLTADTLRARLVLVGGQSTVRHQRVYELHAGDWHDAGPIAGGYRIDHAAAYDEDRGRIWVASHGLQSPDLWWYGLEWPASVVVFGAGCATSTGVAALAARGGERPWLGETMRLEAAGFAAASGAVLIVGHTDSGTIPLGRLPVDLTPFGLLGCFLRVSPDVVVAMSRGAPGAVLDLAIPDVAALLGARLYTQAAVLEPAANPAGVATSNGVALTLGDR